MDIHFLLYVTIVMGGEYKIRKEHNPPSRSSIDYRKEKLQNTRKSAIRVGSTKP